MNFNTITDAGLSQAQFGTLVGVTRITVNTWVRGRFKPRSNLANRVARALEMLAEAVDAGALPVGDCRRDHLLGERLDPIVRALNKLGK